MEITVGIERVIRIKPIIGIKSVAIKAGILNKYPYYFSNWIRYSIMNSRSHLARHCINPLYCSWIFKMTMIIIGKA